MPVLFAADTRAHLLSYTPAVPVSLTPASVAELLAQSLRMPAVLWVTHPRLGPALSRKLGVSWRNRYEMTGSPLPAGGDRTPPAVSGAAVWAIARELRTWMARFHSVASRYLPHYLALHGFLERHRDVISETAAERLLAGAVAASPHWSLPALGM